jgi:hypothetical protein
VQTPYSIFAQSHYVDNVKPGSMSMRHLPWIINVPNQNESKQSNFGWLLGINQASKQASFDLEILATRFCARLDWTCLECFSITRLG